MYEKNQRIAQHDIFKLKKGQRFILKELLPEELSTGILIGLKFVTEQRLVVT